MLNEFDLDLSDVISDATSYAPEFSTNTAEPQKLTLKIQAIVSGANASVAPVRQVPMDVALKVAGRSLSRTIYDITNPERRAFTALREVSDFVRMFTTGDAPKVASHFDLLPLGHPLSSQFADEMETITASALWLAGDPSIPEHARSLVSSALNSEEGSLERIYATGYLSELQGETKPVQVISNLSK